MSREQSGTRRFPAAASSPLVHVARNPDAQPRVPRVPRRARRTDRGPSQVVPEQIRETAFPARAAATIGGRDHAAQPASVQARRVCAPERAHGGAAGRMPLAAHPPPGTANAWRRIRSRKRPGRGWAVRISVSTPKLVGDSVTTFKLKRYSWKPCGVEPRSPPAAAGGGSTCDGRLARRVFVPRIDTHCCAMQRLGRAMGGSSTGRTDPSALVQAGTAVLPSGTRPDGNRC